MEMYRRIGAISLSGAFFALSLSGCAAPKPKSPPPGGPVVPAGPPLVPSSRPDAMDASAVPQGDPASVLALRTAAYSRSMTQALARKDNAKTSPPAPDPADARIASESTVSSTAKASDVTWLDPSTRQLSLFPGGLEPSTPKVSAPPVIVAETAPSQSNVPASVEPAAVKTPPVQLAMSPSRDFPAVASDGVIRTTSDSNSQRLASRAREYPHDVSAQFDYELSRFVADQPVPDLSALASLPGEDSEMLAAELDGLSNFRNNLRANANMLMSQKVAPLLDAAERLRSHAGLTIPVIRLCTTVVNFGNYVPFPGDPPQFTSGVTHPALVYVEVANFTSRLADDRQWQTDLSNSVMLFSEQGMPEWSENHQVRPDSSRSRRRDYFFVQPVSLKGNLPPGRHMLKVTVEDTQAHRIAESTIPLIIESNPSSP